MTDRNPYLLPESREIIRGLMKGRGFKSPRSLAMAAGISQPALSRYLAGTSQDMEMQSWRALAQTLEVTVSQLLGEAPTNPDPAVRDVVRVMEHLPAESRAAMAAAVRAMANALPGEK